MLVFLTVGVYNILCKGPRILLCCMNTKVTRYFSVDFGFAFAFMYVGFQPVKVGNRKYFFDLV